MTKQISILTAFLVSASALAASVAGCELIASVDRSLIGTGGGGGMATTTTSNTTTTSSTTTTTTAPPSCDAGVMACTTPSDCTPAPTTMCVLATCGSGCCGLMNAAKGATCSDNGGKVCDGSGACVKCVVDTDCMASGTVCAAVTCDTSTNTCKTTDAPKGMTCEGTNKVCDGAGACSASHCGDNVKDADETDVDCGGADCGPCNDGLACKAGGDCKNKLCGGMTAACTTGCTCDLPSCSDGVQNGNETDKDCGGAAYVEAGDAGTLTACAKCLDLKHCSASSDCANGNCNGSSPGTCISCMDGVKNGNETDTDCGGADCNPLGKTCAVNQSCINPGDCTSKECGASNKCTELAAGAVCTADVECVAPHLCGTNHTGHCCTAACPNTSATCAASDCTNTGACGYPTATTGCGAASCNAGNSTFTLAGGGACDSAGNCTPATPQPCANNFGCSGTACATSCTNGTTTGCAANHTCVGGTCLLVGGQSCSSGGNAVCASMSCLGGNNCCTATCTTTGTCAATSCTNTGACQGPGAATHCDACNASTSILTPGACSGAGTCTAGTPAACANGLSCASAAACATTCTAGTTTGCADAVNTTCNAGGTACLLNNGQACTADTDCLNNNCSGADGGVGAGTCM